MGDFRYAHTTADAPDEVDVTVAVARGVKVEPITVADLAAGALERLSAELGPYPWPDYTVVVGPDLEDAGIEYPTLVFQGEGNLQQRITAHEAAHQWFYALVGSNQADDPWLDEALATWAGSLVAHELPGVMSIPVPAAAGGKLGAPMTYWSARSPSLYSRGVYIQGAQAVGGLGSERGVACVLRRYVHRNAYRIATPADFLDAADDVYRDARSRFAQYGITG